MFIKSYIDYLRDNPKGYWFKAKWFGWGWTPATWQGWVVTLTYVSLILIIGASAEKNVNTDSEAVVKIIIPVAVLTTTLIFICLWKGERSYWNWGTPKSKRK